MQENYSYTSYPESGNSSPRSREIEFENPPPWEDQQHAAATYKVKFMCSYGGKIQPRPHDNQLSYTGGETKILTVDHNIRFSSLASKLYALSAFDVCFKYQLPGEDLDALISVTNDDDIDHMMHEYDRLYRASPKPARLRLFLFPANSLPVSATQSLDSADGKLERDNFVEALNSGQTQLPKLLDPVTDSVIAIPAPALALVPESQTPLDPIQKHIHDIDMQNLRIAEQQAMYRRQSDENLAAAFSGDYYVQKMPEKASPTPLQGTTQVNLQTPPGYWPESQIPTAVYPPTTVGSDQQQQVYMIQTPTGVYHAPMTRMAGTTGQGYYTMQRMQPDLYREQPVYNVVLPPQSTPPVAAAAVSVATMTAAAPPPAGYADGGFGMVRPATGGGLVVMESGYAQVAYDNAGGRQIYYTAQGPVVAQPLPQAPNQAPYQAMAAAAYNADIRPAGNFNQDVSKLLPAKISQDAL